MEVLKEGLAAEVITQDEFNAMDPSDKTLAWYYQLFKVHKNHTPGSAPPERPIISGSGSLTENISREMSSLCPRYYQGA